MDKAITLFKCASFRLAHPLPTSLLTKIQESTSHPLHSTTSSIHAQQRQRTHVLSLSHTHSYAVAPTSLYPKRVITHSLALQQQQGNATHTKVGLVRLRVETSRQLLHLNDEEELCRPIPAWTLNSWKLQGCSKSEQATLVLLSGLCFCFSRGLSSSSCW